MLGCLVKSKINCRALKGAPTTVYTQALYGRGTDGRMHGRTEVKTKIKQILKIRNWKIGRTEKNKKTETKQGLGVFFQSAPL